MKRLYNTIMALLALLALLKLTNYLIICYNGFENAIKCQKCQRQKTNELPRGRASRYQMEFFMSDPVGRGIKSPLIKNAFGIIGILLAQINYTKILYYNYLMFKVSKMPIVPIVPLIKLNYE
jgi:hypothetical protein